MKFFKKNKFNILKQVLRYSFILVLFFSIFINYSAALEPRGDGGITVETGIENPLNPELSDIPDFINALITIVLFVGVPIVTLAIIYSGFLFVQASGNSEKLGTAKKALLYSVIGAALLLGAFVLSEAIQGTVDQLK